MIKIQSFFLLIYVDILLKRKGFQHTCETIKEMKKTSEFKPVEVEKLYSICNKINKAVDGAIFFPKALCLHRSLIGFYILSKKGIDVEFCLGASSELTFASHAWLEYKGIIINDNKEFVEKFNPIMKF